MVAVVLVAVVCEAAIGLTAVAFFVVLEAAHQVASIVGALVGRATGYTADIQVAAHR